MRHRRSVGNFGSVAVGQAAGLRRCVVTTVLGSRITIGAGAHTKFTGRRSLIKCAALIGRVLQPAYAPPVGTFAKLQRCSAGIDCFINQIPFGLRFRNIIHLECGQCKGLRSGCSRHQLRKIHIAGNLQNITFVHRTVMKLPGGSVAAASRTAYNIWNGGKQFFRRFPGIPDKRNAFINLKTRIVGRRLKHGFGHTVLESFGSHFITLSGIVVVYHSPRHKPTVVGAMLQYHRIFARCGIHRQVTGPDTGYFIGIIRQALSPDRAVGPVVIFFIFMGLCNCYARLPAKNRAVFESFVIFTIGRHFCDDRKLFERNSPSIGVIRFKRKTLGIFVIAPDDNHAGIAETVVLERQCVGGSLYAHYVAQARNNRWFGACCCI